FFRTSLLDPKNVKWATHPISDYAIEGSAESMWSRYNGAQTNDPAKLAAALLKIVAMDSPPKTFAGGADAVAMIRPAIESRLNELRTHEALSGSMEMLEPR